MLTILAEQKDVHKSYHFPTPFLLQGTFTLKMTQFRCFPNNFDSQSNSTSKLENFSDSVPLITYKSWEYFFLNKQNAFSP